MEEVTMDVKIHLSDRELMEKIENEDPRYMPLTPKHWQNGLSIKSQIKHWLPKMNIWEKENKDAMRNNGKLLKEYKMKQLMGEL